MDADAEPWLSHTQKTVFIVVVITVLFIVTMISLNFAQSTKRRGEADNFYRIMTNAVTAALDAKPVSFAEPAQVRSESARNYGAGFGGWVLVENGTNEPAMRWFRVLFREGELTNQVPKVSSVQIFHQKPPIK
jgi:hypothetical protein